MSHEVTIASLEEEIKRLQDNCDLLTIEQSQLLEEQGKRCFEAGYKTDRSIPLTKAWVVYERLYL